MRPGAPGEAPSKPRARRTKARPGKPAERGELVLTGVLALAVLGSVLALGAVHTEVLLAVAAWVGVGVALFLRGARSGDSMPEALPAAVPLAAGLAIYTLLQALPLPLGFVQRLSPVSAEVWRGALLPLGEELTRGSLSIDPGASLVEALKWLTYGGVFALAAHVGRRRGAVFVAELLLLSASMVALVTLGHGLLDAELVFGIYRPSFRPVRWATSPLLNPNNLAGYLNLGTFAGLGLLVSSRTRLPRWLVALAVALLVGQTVLAASRGGVLGLLVGLLLFAGIVPRIGRPRSAPARTTKRPFWTPPVVTALLGGVVLAWFGARRTTWEELRDEGYAKLSILEWTRPLIADHPWFGVGGGAFETAFPPYRAHSGPLWAHPENFVLAWICEWGLPVGIAAFVGFLWIFRPTQLGAHRSRLAGALTLGVAVLALQNLVDLGFSLPGVFIAWATALGGLWGSWDAERSPSSTPEPMSSETARAHARRTSIAGAVGLALGVLVWGMALFGARDSALLDRERLAARYRATRFDSAPERERFFTELRAALLRHPGDPFLPSLGALAAARTPGGRPLAWAARALERDGSNGRHHLLLAELLQRRGRLHQALLHLRLGAQHDPTLARVLTERALRWTRSQEELMRVVPEGPRGGVVLVELARRLNDAESAALRRHLLEEALRRDATLIDAHVLLASTLLRDAAAGRAPCEEAREPCLDQVERHLATLASLDPTGRSSLEIRGRLLTLRGKRQEGVALLLNECPRDRASCLHTAVELSAEVSDLPLDAPTQAYLAAACRSATSCATARAWVGDLYARRELWGPALAHYTQAAEDARSAQAWLRVADAASRQGAHRRALDALRRAESLLTKGEEKLHERATQLRGEIVARMAQAPAGP